ncbi:unnamed protein product [Gongylonema pulchrum]|uniref:RRM domain-containing protein n=1 Tax=Gongylonema pulchrum TaxID=637853 RepID=A0A183ERG5_9BILA|nr:unnamed protein product [Gongylonema pulchrum]
MRDVYGDVHNVAIDTDRQKYPIGSARVAFFTRSAYCRAVESGFLEIRTSKFTKRLQIDPFLEDSNCSRCESREAEKAKRSQFSCISSKQPVIFIQLSSDADQHLHFLAPLFLLRSKTIRLISEELADLLITGLGHA